MSDCLRLYIHESSAERCLAKGVHRSGSRLRPISFNDFLYGSGDLPCGVVLSVETERVDPENWLYRVTYVPQEGTLHPINSFVLWRNPPAEPAVPPAVERRMQPVQETVTPANGRKRNKRQSVSNGQHGKVAQASAALATATV